MNNNIHEPPEEKTLHGASCCRTVSPGEKMLNEIAGRLCESYADGRAVNDADSKHLPHRAEVEMLTEKLLELVFPGFGDERRFFSSRARRDTLELLSEVCDLLTTQIRRSMRSRRDSDCGECSGASGSCRKAALELLSSLPELREVMKQDVAAAIAGDPAAHSDVEVILAYPGIKAVTIQRMAHILYRAGIPILPRMMTEYAHTLTGIDIHPGAQIGRGFFIDHGTGVVVGETAVIGDHVQLYQGVTLGAFSFPKDACGMLIRNTRRHPTIGDRVTIYANATILGDIVVGEGSIVGANVWLTESLPPESKISMTPPQQKIRTPGTGKKP